MTYWEQRAVSSAKRMDSAISGYTFEMVQSFENAKKQLQSEIYSFYGKYAVENKITFAQAQKQLSFAELKSFKGDLKEYERLAKNSIGTYDLTVSNLSKKARITRLQALNMQCDTILQKLYQQQKTTIEDISTRLYSEQYYKKQFDIERYTGFQFNFAAPSLEAIKKVVSMPVNGVDISTALWRQDIDTGFKIRQTLNEMFITGKPPQAFSDNLQKIIGKRNNEGNLTGKKYEAYRLLYNESSFVTEQSALQAYKDDEVEEYEIIATLDYKTSQICRDMDSKHFEVSKAIPEVNYPPFHVNCRTTTAPYIANLKEFSQTRTARNENGKSVRTKDVSYNEWKANVDKAAKSDIIKVGCGNVEQAKKRDHKINITDMAIQKVGQVNISDFSKDQNILLQQKHKDLLRISQTQNNSNEVLKICDINFKSEVNVNGDEFVVKPGNNPFAVAIVTSAKEKTLAFLHNHPSTNIFSIGDIDTFVVEGSIKLLSVVTNQGEIFALNKTENYSYNKVRKILNDIYYSFGNSDINNAEFVKLFLKNCHEGGVEYVKSN